MLTRILSELCVYSVSRSDEGEEANSGVVDLSLMTPNRSKRRQEQTDDNDYDAA